MLSTTTPPTLLLLLMLLWTAPAVAQSAAAAQTPYAAMVIVALILALMGAALLVVLVVVCHFAWLRQTSLKRRAARQPQLALPSTVPKGQTVTDASLKLTQRHVPQPEPVPSIADPAHIGLQIQEPVIEIVKVPAIRSQPKLTPQSPRVEMRHTASQFLEFLSRKWNIEQHPAPAAKEPEMTTFKPPQADSQPSGAAPQNTQPVWPQLGDAFFDICEQDVGQYDNALSQAAGDREADRYEIALELRDTRRSRASTPGLSGRISEAESDDQQQQQQQQQQEQKSDWFEEVSEAL